MNSEIPDELDISPVWGGEWIETYLEVGDRYSVDNESLHTGFMLALLGQAVPEGHLYLGDDKHHVRVHPMMMQDSGSGKDPAFDFAKAVARSADIAFTDSNDLTNAGLIGSYDSTESRFQVQQSGMISSDSARRRSYSNRLEREPR